eukprot:4424741-Pyramimonas_sp.AAC.2
MPVARRGAASCFDASEVSVRRLPDLRGQRAGVPRRQAQAGTRAHGWQTGLETCGETRGGDRQQLVPRPVADTPHGCLLF